MEVLPATHASSIPDSFVLPAEKFKAATAASLEETVLPARHRHGPRPRRGPPRHPRRRQGSTVSSRSSATASPSRCSIRDMEALCREFFEMPAADKAEFYSEDKSKPNRFFSGTNYETLGERYWRDCLRLVYPLPSGDTSACPQATQAPEVVGNYTALTRGLAMEILQLLCEGMGLRPRLLRRSNGDISCGRAALDINSYPPCPDPSRTLGLPPHCDRDLITVLLLAPPPASRSPTMATGSRSSPCQTHSSSTSVVTNGMLKSVEHRAATNSAAPQLSVAAFIVPADDCVVSPNEVFVGDDNPPRYRTMSIGEFKRLHNVVNLGASINQSIDVKNNQHKDEI
ncbi:unnamed protein product [Urochloa decumbens]|uniref:Isopenicillin N synthase-like Fe(2+) 2OG dioxygenase domain-containing protein n=1 Tax=Urochloa decumbens TaxID=240449 RepID=A0ABC8WJG9_9POAL